MELTMVRIKSGRETEPMFGTKTLAETIDLIVDCELNWGGKATKVDNVYQVETTVFGDLDKTTIKGEAKELLVMGKVFDAYREGRTNGVIKLMFELMNLTYDSDLVYSFKDTCLVFNMYTEEGLRDPAIITLIQSKRKESPKPISQADIDNLIDAKNKLPLASDDGAMLVLNSTLLKG